MLCQAVAHASPVPSLDNTNPKVLYVCPFTLVSFPYLRSVSYSLAIA